MRTRRFAPRTPRGSGLTLLQQLDSDLLYHTQVTAPGRYTTVEGTSVTELVDWTGRGANLTPFSNTEGIQYAPSGGPNDQPYAYSASYSAPDFLFGSIITIPEASRVEFYAVMRSAIEGSPIEIQKISDSSYPFAASSDTDIFLDAQPTGGALQEINVGSAGVWALYSVGYLASGLDGRVNGVSADPNFTGSGTCRGGSCYYAALYGSFVEANYGSTLGDALAFSCAVLNPDETKRGIVYDYVSFHYGL